MTIDELFEVWAEDAKIDKTEIGEESLKKDKLHSKYYPLFATERKALRELESDFKRLRLRKQEFYAQGHDDLSRQLGWKLPPQGKVLKGEVQSYVDVDPDVIAGALEVGLQNEKVSFLESVLKSIANRSFTLANYIKWTIFTNGG